MKEFRKPDLNAPRYRAQRQDILNKDFYNLFRETNPKYSQLTDKDIRTIIKEVNGKIWGTVIDERNGIELPEQLGYIFIGSCPAPKKDNPNYHISKKLDKIIQHRNWESDQYLAKIFYTNAASKYRFQFSNLWGLSLVRQFSRKVSEVYPENFNKYIVVEDYKRINAVFSKKMYGLDMRKIEKEILKTVYNEFDL
jgi:hypothetical protein